MSANLHLVRTAVFALTLSQRTHVSVLTVLVELTVTRMSRVRQFLAKMEVVAPPTDRFLRLATSTHVRAWRVMRGAIVLQI